MLLYRHSKLLQPLIKSSNPLQYLSESRRQVQDGSERWVNGLMRFRVSIYVSLERVPHVTAEGYDCTFGWLYFQWGNKAFFILITA